MTLGPSCTSIQIEVITHLRLSAVIVAIYSTVIFMQNSLEFCLSPSGGNVMPQLSAQGAGDASVPPRAIA